MQAICRKWPPLPSQPDSFFTETSSAAPRQERTRFRFCPQLLNSMALKDWGSLRFYFELAPTVPQKSTPGEGVVIGAAARARGQTVKKVHIAAPDYDVIHTEGGVERCDSCENAGRPLP